MLRLLGCLSINAEVDLTVEVVVEEDIMAGVVAVEEVAIIVSKTMMAINSVMVGTSNVRVVTNVMAAIRIETSDINSVMAAFSKEMEVISNAVAIGDQVVTEVAVVDEVTVEETGTPKAPVSPEVVTTKGEIGYVMILKQYVKNSNAILISSIATTGESSVEIAR